MKIAVLSDVHGNVPALEAVLDDVDRWGADRIIVNGDLINRGPCSLECLRLLDDRRIPVLRIKGNHECFVVDSADRPMDPGEPLYDFYCFGYWTAYRLGPAEVDRIRGWGEHLDLNDPKGGSLHITHGSREGNRSGIHPETPDGQLLRKLGDPRDLFVASHTHKPLLRRFRGTLVVNTGSVGQPFDGDPRSAYARIECNDGQWQARIARVPFDRQRALRDFETSGFLAECGPLARIVYHELEHAQMHLGRWTGLYYEGVKAREISVADAARDYLQSL